MMNSPALSVKCMQVAGLLLAQPGHMPGPMIGRQLGVSRAMVHRYIHQLIRAGWQIEAISNRGYRLLHVPDRISMENIKRQLCTQALGRVGVCLDTASSTNEVAKQYALEGAPHGYVVLAEQQTQGKGRRGRRWASPRAGGLYMSLVLRPNDPPHRSQWVTLMASMAVCNAIEELLDIRPSIKWPNDLIIDDKKVCGILSELQCDMETIHWLVVGIGVNTQLNVIQDNPDLSEAASLAQYAASIDRCRLAAMICNQLEALLEWVKSNGFESFLALYRKECITLGRPVMVHEADRSYPAHAIGIDCGGLLQIEYNGEVKSLSAGDVSIRIG